MQNQSNARKIIQSARAKNQKTLSEYQAKQLLACYAIPVTNDILAIDLGQAREAAATIGFPVAMKACSPELLHKTEARAVVLDIPGQQQVADAFQGLMGVTPQPDGILVQPMVRGRRELVVGMNRDPQFGPCVMLGLGGIFAEALEDTAFRAAPFDRVEALDMVAELRGQQVFGTFRGEPPVDLEILADILLAAGETATQNPDIAEIDINPLIVDPDGKCVAVDALIVLGSGG